MNAEASREEVEKKMLMRFDTFRDFDRFTDQFLEGRRPRVVPMDAYRLDDGFHVNFDLPGVDLSSIELTVEKNVLTVKAERHWSGEGVETLVSERPQGTFTRQLFLGDSLDAQHIEASYQNGVLSLRIPVLESAKPRQIRVHTTDKAETITAGTA
jgi:HSP20 family protein